MRFGKAWVLMDCFNFKEIKEIRILRILIGENEWEELVKGNREEEIGDIKLKGEGFNIERFNCF